MSHYHHFLNEIQGYAVAVLRPMPFFTNKNGASLISCPVINKLRISICFIDEFVGSVGSFFSSLLATCPSGEERHIRDRRGRSSTST